MVNNDKSEHDNLEETPYYFENVPRKLTSYKGYKKSSQYLTMRDGVKIAIELVLPEDLSPKDKISIILLQTRYWRDYLFRIPFKWLLKEVPDMKSLHELGISRGYGFIYVDVRGAGASFGTRPYPWSKDEVEDGREIIDWIIRQPWSDGNIVTMGGSYGGVTAEYVATLNHLAVKGILPYSNQWDAYTEVAFPGGAYNHFFIRIWGLLGEALDMNNSRKFLGVLPLLFFLVKGVKPVETDKDKLQLKEAIKDHSSNIYVFQNEDVVTYRDDPLVYQKEDIADTVSVFSKKEEIEKANVPFYCWGGWLDGATSDNIISRFMTYKNPMRAIIGDFDHGMRRRANPYHPETLNVIPEKKIQQKVWLDFFDICIHGKEPFSEKVLYYYTMGEEKWKKTDVWPPAGHSMQRWYFSENNSLSTTKPPEELGEDTYQVDHNITSGKGNRWHIHYAQKMNYKKRDKIDKKLLTYTSASLKEDVEITGHPVITIFLTSTHEDGVIFAYLEDVDEEGKVTYITEGELRFIHRKISKDEPPYKIMVPYHSFKKKDSLPLVPGEISEIKFGFLPTSVLVRKGHRLRVAIAGADKDTFSRYPTEGNPVITIKRTKDYASFIDISVIKR